MFILEYYSWFIEMGKACVIQENLVNGQSWTRPALNADKPAAPLDP